MSMGSKKKRSSQGYSEDIYTVERIVGKRVYKGKVQYLIKWENYDDAENTWENQDNVFCDDLVAEYERDHPEPPTEVMESPRLVGESAHHYGNNHSAIPASSSKDSTPKKPKKTRQDIVSNGVWEDDVDEVATMERNSNGDLIIHLLWKDGTTSAHKSNIVNINCPHKVIRFYEERLRFKTAVEESQAQ
jgi:chromobox protein 1